MRKTLFLLGSITFLSATIGCQAPPQPTGPTLSRVSAQAPEQYEQLWEAAGNTLREYYFRLDRQDLGQGVITTFPETSTAWFEVWRPQPEPAYYWAEANQSTIQRQATVLIKPVQTQGDYEVNVKIDRYRYSLEERQIDNSAAALHLYSGIAPTYEGRMAKPADSSHWIALGRDGPMEERILAGIIHKYTGTTTQPAEFGQP